MASSTKTIAEKASFNFIRYANCWEDPQVLMEGLSPKPGSKILSIGSAGDNSFSLLTTNPSLVAVADINASQLYLIELKKICFQHLTYQEILDFLGFNHCDTRIEIFKSIAHLLSNDAQRFWKFNMESLEKGVIHQGKFEKYFHFFAKKVLPFIHNKTTTQKLLAEKSSQEQQIFYDNIWNNRRWRLLFKLFFSKFILGRFGRDPAFLKEVTIPVAKFIFDQAAKELSSPAAQHNYILRYNLTADFGHLLPHYLQVENFELIKNNIDALQLQEGYADTALKKFGKMDAMNLSNIFEYMNATTFTDTAQQLVLQLNPNGRLAYWNLMVPRRISSLLPNELIYLEKISNELSEKDMGFFYRQFIVEEKL